ncbi:EMG1/NEP1 methyltransferase domain containing protein [Amanita muscaria]
MLPIQAHVPRARQGSNQRRFLSGFIGWRGTGKEGDVKYTLLNCDDHQGILAKMRRDIADARPDITHQCLLTLLNSPLNKAGLLQVYTHTAKGVLMFSFTDGGIESATAAQALDSGRQRTREAVRSDKEPGSRLFTPRYFQNYAVRRCSNKKAFPIPTSNTSFALDSDLCRRYGKKKGDFADAYIDDKISVSDYPLSASVACGKQGNHMNHSIMARAHSLFLFCAERYQNNNEHNNRQKEKQPLRKQKSAHKEKQGMKERVKKGENDGAIKEPCVRKKEVMDITMEKFEL